MEIRSNRPIRSLAQTILILTTVVALVCVLAVSPAPSQAQTVSQIGRRSPERAAILDAERAVIEAQLGIKVKFVVVRLAAYGDWVYAALRPRSATGERIDYRRTLYAKVYLPDMDSDHIDVLLKRHGAGWTIVEQAFLPTDVVWEPWQNKYQLPRALFLTD